MESVQIQEIDEGVFGAAGTGATTWESSIAMSLFFASQPEMLRGNVIELGSGVGLGGILNVFGQSLMNPQMQQRQQLQPEGSSTVKRAFLHSMTLSDYNPHVLIQCQNNLHSALPLRAGNQYFHVPPIRLAKLDWYDFARPSSSDTTQQHVHEYDTVIACDCAYRYPDLATLATAMESLLRRSQGSNIHLFGPINRSALHELTRLLRDDKGMHVVMERLEMQRYRLKPLAGWNNSRYMTHANKLFELLAEQEECPYAGRCVPRFLHVSASLQDSKSPRSQSKTAIADID